MKKRKKGSGGKRNNAGRKPLFTEKDSIYIKIEKEEKERIKKYAEFFQESLSEYCRKAINTRISFESPLFKKNISKKS